jgi:hypothetical protein
MSLFSKNDLLFEATEGLEEETAASSSIADPPTTFRPRYRTIQRNQSFLAPVDLERMIDQSHPVRTIWDLPLFTTFR